jgi:hypothetical protein
VNGDAHDHLPQVHRWFVTEQPEAARIYYRLMLVVATRSLGHGRAA